MGSFVKKMIDQYINTVIKLKFKCYALASLLRWLEKLFSKRKYPEIR